MADLNARLRRLEQAHIEQQWCRCPYDAERARAETARAMDTGEPTPSGCDRCGGARISIQYVEWRDLPWNRSTFPGAETA